MDKSECVRLNVSEPLRGKVKAIRIPPEPPPSKEAQDIVISDGVALSPFCEYASSKVRSLQAGLPDG